MSVTSHGRRTPLLTRTTALVLSWILSSMAFVGEVAALAPTAPAEQSPARVEDPPASPTPSARVPGAILVPKRVKPILECVIRHSPGSYTAYYGYDNQNNYAVTIPVGDDNYFHPGAQDRGQPTVFAPGKTPSYPNALFSVPFGPDKLYWSLRGPDGQLRTVTASGGSPYCPTDDTPPKVTITSPTDGSFVGATPLFRVIYDDPSGIQTASFSAQVDGVDRSSRFTVGPTEATWTPSAADALGSGPHDFTASIQDTLRNVGTVKGKFTVDAAAPVVVVDSPAEGSYHRTTPTLTGTVQDEDPETAVLCRRGTTSVPATVSWSGRAGSFSCAVPLSEGANEVVVEATDRAGQTGSATRHLQFDTGAPQVTILEPSPDSYTAATSVTVSGGVVDASPITILRVQGVTATVTGNTFTASGVPVGAGPTVTLTAEAEDAAGNTGTGSQTVHVDRTPPVVSIDTPSHGAVVPGRTVEVTGTVAETAPFTVDVNGEPATVTGQSFSATVTATASGPLALTATARDAAAQTGTASVTVIVDRTAPLLSVTSPVDGLVTREPSVTVAGTVTDDSVVALTVDGTPVPVVAGAFSHEKTLPSETTYAIEVVATDAAGRTATETVTLRVDRTPPQVVVAAPAAGSLVTVFPIAVSGTVQDASAVELTVEGVGAVVTRGAWTASVPGVAAGAQALHVVATDEAGNQAVVDHPVVVDLGAPVVTITAPAAGALTSAASVTVEGTVAEDQLAGVVVRGIAAAIAPEGPGLWRFTAAGVPLDEGVNLLQAVATDAAGQTGSATVEVIRDATPPQLTLQAPDSALPGATVAVEAFPTDASGIARVDLFLGDVLVGSPTAPPYGAPVTIPSGTPSGTTLVVRAVAVDLAGNQASASRGIAVASNGIVAGQVLSDATSLPIEGAVVRLLSGTPFETATDARGRYTVPVAGTQALLAASRDGHVAVERATSVAPGAGTIPVDARLTPLAAPVAIGPDGGSLQVEVARPSGAGPVTMTATVAVPAGAVTAAAFRLTALSAQGLPNLLPLGWAPVLAFDLRADAPIAFPLEATLTGLPAGPLHLASYSPTLHAWLMVASALDPASGALAPTLPSPGAYALVRADEVEPALPLPAPGEPLPSAAFAAIPEGAASTSTVTPAVLPPTGGTARGALTVTSPAALPSGTVVQAEVRETFTLVAGPVVSEEVRTQDLLLARDSAAPDAPLRAEVPITAARTFGAADLVEGRVHLDILAGRESVRGATGGQQPVTVTDGEAMLRVPAGALPEDTVVALDAVPLSPFLPQVAGLTAVAEVLVGLQGRTLGLAAELSVAGSGIPAGETLWLARIERPSGVPLPTVVGRAELVEGRVVTAAAPGLPGLRTEGRYVFFRTSRPVGFVTGVTRTSAGPIAALVQTAALPFVGLSGSDGAYTVLAEAGSSVVVSARALVTTQAGSETVALVEGTTTTADILLAGAQTVATVTPADGTTSVPTGARVEIRASAALAPASITADTVRLVGPAPVPLRFLLSASGKVLQAIPEEPLLADTEYALVVSGLLDLAGAPVAVPATSFRTKDDTPPVYDTGLIRFSFPDANGQVRVEAPPGTMPSGTEILIINSGNGVVVTFEFLEDGSLLGEFPATLNDQLLVTVTDPFGNVTTFQRSQYVAPDGTTAVGAGGGTVTAADGSELRLPAGATPQAVRLKITPFDETAPQAQQPPSFGTDGNGDPLAHFGAGLTIESPDKPTFAKEVDIAFPLPEGLPENPNDAFFYVFRRLTGPNGEVLNEVIDQAFVEGEGAERKVVTASFPFLGFVATAGLVANHVFLMYTYNALLPGEPLPGSVTGKVLRAVWPEGASQPSFVPVTNGTTRVRIANPGPGQAGLVAAVHPVTGTFTLWDTTYTGGNVDVTATLTNAAGQVETVTGTAVEANPANWATTGLRFYRNIATVNLTFPLESTTGVPPTLSVGLVNTGSGQPVTGGIVPEGTPLKAVLTATNATLGGALLQGLPCTVTHPDPTDLARGEVDLSPGSACPVSAAGSYTLTASATPAQGAPITASRSLLVVVAGGGNTSVIEGVPPTVVDAQPPQGATGVPVTTLPQLIFSEPVTGIGPGVLTLHEMVDGAPGPEVAFTPVAVLRNGTVVENPTVDAQVVSLTARPLVSLRYGTSYRLALGSGVADLDVNPGPRELAPPTEWTFRTFAPTGVGGSEEDFGSAGITLIDDRAFLAEIIDYTRGSVRAFDLSDPQLPVEIESAKADLQQRPVDIWAREGGDTGRDELAVGVTITAASKPSNLHLFDVQERESTQWVGVTSVSNSTLDGILHRVVFQGRYVYALTQRKGIQVIDTQEAKALFQAQTGGVTTSPGYFQMLQKMNTEGQGFGQAAIVATIPYRYDQTEQWNLWDLDVASLSVGGVAQPIAFSVGEQRLASNWYLVSANPQTIARVATTPLTGPGGVLFRGRQMGLGRLLDRDLAVVVGSGPFGPSGEEALGLRVFDVTSPATPLPRGFLVFTDLEGFSGDVTDVQVKGDKALVAGTEGVVLVSIADATQPQVIGVVSGAGGRLAVGEGDLEGLLFSTARSVFGGSTPLGGVQTNALDKVTLVTSVKENPVILAENRRSVEPQVVKVRVIPVPDQITSSEVEVLHQSVPAQTLPVTLTAQGTGQVTLATGLHHPLGITMRAQLVVNRADPGRPRPLARRLPSELFEVLPNEPLTLTADEDPLDVAAVNQAVLARLQAATTPAYQAPALEWRVTGTPGLAVPNLDAPPDAIYTTGFRNGRVAGETQEVILQFPPQQLPPGVLGGTLGRSATLTIVPGRARTGSMRAEGPPQAPDELGIVPADGTTAITVVLEDIRDLAGNRVVDGTKVHWTVIGDGGVMLEEDSVTTDGRAISRYQAGIEPTTTADQIFVKAAADDREWLQPIEQRPLTVELVQEASSPPHEIFRATARWGDDYPVANDAPYTWSTTYGAILWEPVGGASIAQWRSVAPAGLEASSAVTVNLGRAGRATLVKRLGTGAAIGATLSHSLLVGNQPNPIAAVTDLEDPASSDGHERMPVAAVASSLMATAATLDVEGPPGAIVTVTLGSTHGPAVQPVAEWPLDEIESGGVGEVYGSGSASVGSGISHDMGIVAAQGSSLHFTGVGGLTVEEAPYLGLSSEFGVSGFVRFDEPTPGQIVVEKAGSYAVTVVGVAGESFLEFTAVSGGTQYRALSPQALAASTWYHFSALSKGGRLRLAVGTSPNVGVSDPIGAIDVSEEPLVFGSSLVGHLDRLQFYDLARTPLLVFPGNVTQIDVALDGEGRGQTTISATGVWVTPQPFEALAGSVAAVSPDSVPVGQKVPLRFHFALDPPTQQTESVLHHLGVHTADSAAACFEGIATGENDEVSGIACDISVSLIVPLEGALAVRDLTVTAKNIIKNKATVGNYVTGAIALITILPKRLPVIGPVLRRLSNAASQINVPWVRKKLAGKALDAAVEGTEGITRTADESLIRIAAGESGPGARQDLLNLINGIDAQRGEAAWDTIQTLAKNCDPTPLGAPAVPLAPSIAAQVDACYVPELLLGTLNGIAARQGPQAFWDVLEVIGKIDLPTLSADGLEGIAITMRRLRSTNSGGYTRISNMWDDIVQFAPADRQREVADNLFKWIKEGEAANVPGWDDFLKKGPGTLNTSTHGAYHVLEYLSRDLNWTGIEQLEYLLHTSRGRRYLDIKMADGRIFELKNLMPNHTIANLAQVRKDISAAKRRVTVSTNSPQYPVLLKAELEKLHYVFRGTPTESQLAIDLLRAEARKVLRKWRSLEQSIKTPAIGRTVPF